MESSNGNRKSFVNNKRKSNIPQPSSCLKMFLIRRREDKVPHLRLQTRLKEDEDLERSEISQ